MVNGKLQIDVGGYGIIWNDDIDLSCDELFENGETVKTPFDGLMAFTDAALIWGKEKSSSKTNRDLQRGLLC